MWFYSCASGAWTLSGSFIFHTNDDMASATGYTVSITHSIQPGVDFEAVASNAGTYLLTLFEKAGGVWRFAAAQNCPAVGSDSGAPVIAVASPGIVSCGVSGAGIYLLYFYSILFY